jgi:hypothetical protein
MIGVVLDGEFKVGQYGQWDGYPSGQGTHVLGFLKDTDIEVFKDKVRELRWITQPEINAVNADPNWTTNFPHLSRGAGAEILDMVLTGDVPFVFDQSDFALDSLFCEWAYVLDLDKGELEVYEGFQKTPPTEGRWVGKMDDDQKSNPDPYYPVALKKTYKFSELPDEETFVSELEPQDDEEE